MSFELEIIHARQILDSRGNPTLECDVVLDDGSAGRATFLPSIPLRPRHSTGNLDGGLSGTGAVGGSEISLHLDRRGCGQTLLFFFLNNIILN